jgi:AraC family transcriptional regulator
VSGSHRLEYETRVNRVIDHIREHLGDQLSLAELARVAAFSPFHFHRVFRAMTGETLFGFIHRQRIEKAARALLTRADGSVLEVALDHGFSSAATFARAFRSRFGMSASQWRAGGAAGWQRRHRPRSKPGKQLRKASKASGRRVPHTAAMGRLGSMAVQVKDLPPYRVAYMRCAGPYGAHGIPALWTRFNRWMETRGLLAPTRLTLGVAHDDPGITAAERCRYDACVVVPPAFEPDRRVTMTDVAGGRYAVAEFVGTAHEIGAAWDGVFAAWLPGSAWQPDDRPCYEAYRGNPMVNARTGVFRCQLCLPVRPL